MAYEGIGRVQGVTPARRKNYERNLFYMGFSSTANASSDGCVWSTGIYSTAPYNLLLNATGGTDYIYNYSTRLDWIHIYFNPNCAASSFYVVYTNLDHTTATQTMIISTAVTLANGGYNWVVPLPPRTHMYPVANLASSTGFFMLQTAEAFGDQIFGNK